MGPFRRWALVTVLSATIPFAIVVAAGARPDTPTTIRGKVISKVYVVRDVASQTTQAFAWTDLTGASVTVKVPANTSAILVARFNANSLCLATPPQFCTVRILVGDTEAEPAAGTDFSFDTAEEDNPTHNASLERSAGPLSAGTYVVKVQWGTSPGLNTGTFTLSAWSFSLELAPAA